MLVLLCAGRAQAQYGFVQQATPVAQGQSASPIQVPSSGHISVSEGDLLVAPVCLIFGSTTVTISDGVDTWTCTAACPASSTVQAFICHTVASTSRSEQITVTGSGSVPSLAAGLAEWSGNPGAFGAVPTGTCDNGGGTGPDAGTITPGKASDLIVSAVCGSGFASISSGPAPAGSTCPPSGGNSGGFCGLTAAFDANFADIIPAYEAGGGSAQSPSWTMNSSHSWAGISADFGTTPTSEILHDDD